jgi:diketogulonate reductase-like aldo/keto reductase
MMLPIPGTSSIEHLEENVAAASIRLTEEEYERLASVPEMVIGTTRSHDSVNPAAVRGRHLIAFPVDVQLQN